MALKFNTNMQPGSSLVNASSSALLPVLLQEVQLMLTNMRDAFRDKSRSPNIVPFHVRYFSSSAIVTLSLRGAVFPIFDFKKCRDLEIGVRGHSRSLIEVPFYRLGVVVSY